MAAYVWKERRKCVFFVRNSYFCTGFRTFHGNPPVRDRTETPFSRKSLNRVNVNGDECNHSAKIAFALEKIQKSFRELL